MGAPPCNCHCSLEEVEGEAANRWSDVARAASLAVRRAKAARRSALLREGDSALGKMRRDGMFHAEVGRRKSGCDEESGAGETGEVASQVFKFSERQKPLRLETLDKS